jgi:hypothetical protein
MPTTMRIPVSLAAASNCRTASPSTHVDVEASMRISADGTLAPYPFDFDEASTNIARSDDDQAFTPLPNFRDFGLSFTNHPSQRPPNH